MQGKVQSAIPTARLVDRVNVGMVEPGRGAGFSQKPLDDLRGSTAHGMENLNCHETGKQRIRCQVNNAEAATS